MKVLQVLDTLLVGGGERIAINCTNLLNRAGHSCDLVKIFDIGDQDDQIEAPGKVFQIHSKGRIDLKAWRELAKIARNYDVIHVHMRGAMKYTMLAKAVFGFKAPVLFHDHYGDIDIDKSVPRIFKWIFGRKDVWFAGVAEVLKDWAINEGKIKASKAFTLENTILKIETEGPHFTLPTDGPIRLMQISNYRRSKNLELGIRFVSALKEKGHKVVLHQIGQPIETAYCEELAALRKELNVESEVIPIHNCTNPQAIMPNYDFGIHTAHSESGPLSVIEFMSQGVPFLAADTGQVIQQIKFQTPEMIVSDYEIETWVGYFEELLKHDRATIVSKIQSIFAEQFSEEKYLKQCVFIYNEMLK